MEILLNFAWATLAIALVALWFRAGDEPARARRTQIVAVAMLIAILFPVISVSDDLLAIQNPTETNTCIRRATSLHLGAHPLLPTMDVVPPPAWTGLAFAFLRYVSPAWAITPHVQLPLPAAIQNRPPPAA